MPKKKVILLIMDGWGKGKIKSADAIQQAKTPFVDSLYNKYPNANLITCGPDVGLPEGQMGNSEVGHLNLGAGRIVYQELQRINVAIKDGTFYTNKPLLDAIDFAKQHNKAFHLIGLVSDGGVHSHIDHVKAITDLCKKQGLEKVFIHAFTDGRDTDPNSGLDFIKELEAHIIKSTGKIATVSGRYYAMDRDKRWERVKLAYDALVKGIGHKSTNAIKAIEDSYELKITDEFILPTIITDEKHEAIGTIKQDDVVLSFNFRTDRCREITEVLSQKDLPEFDMKKLSLHFNTMTEYDKTFSNVHVLFETDNLNHTLGQVIAENGLTQIRIAETEKYPHVSFFFSGGRENTFEGEKRIMIQSPKVATYDLQPEMSAFEMTDAILPEIENETADFICLNFANADMVGHTGVWEAAVKAVETVDQCVEKIVTKALEHGYTIFLTADHGNSDYMINDNGTPNTAHTLNPVPLFLIDNNRQGNLQNGKLADIAPTILNMLGLNIPKEMTGTILIDSL
jgi:2,3-bisphosphoglycerate-independent phosphoglycerate mutase